MVQLQFSPYILCLGAHAPKQQDHMKGHALLLPKIKICHPPPM